MPDSFTSKYHLIKHSNAIQNRNMKYSLILRVPFINDEIKTYIKLNIIKEIISNVKGLAPYENIDVEKTLVKNPTLIWSNFCANKFPNQPKNIISITGTNGKTSTCSYIAQILTKMSFPNILISTTGTYINYKKISENSNSTPDAMDIHSALHAFSNNYPNGFAIIETTSIGIEEHRTHNIHPKVAIFTNLTKEHMEYHKNMKNYLNAKLKLGSYCDKFFVHKSINQNIYPKYGDELILTEVFNNKSIFTYKIDQKIYKIAINLLGRFNAENVLSTIIALKEFFSIEQFVSYINDLEPAEGRLNQYENIIIDYAHTLDAVDNIFKTIKQQDNLEKIITVIGFGGNSDWTRLTKISEYLQNNSDRVILTTDNPRNNDPMEIALKSKKICSKAEIELNREEAIRKAYKLAGKNDIILLLGKGHEPYMIIKNKKEPYSEKETVIKIIKENKS